MGRSMVSNSFVSEPSLSSCSLTRCWHLHHAVYKENQIVAGGIANRTTEVVGLNNVFVPRQETERYWEGLLSMTATYYPSLPIVGYEKDENLTMALHVGFTTLGQLRIWIKED
jgi:hypothetical protein